MSMRSLFKVKEVDISHWKEGDKFYSQVVRTEYKDSLFTPLHKMKDFLLGPVRFMHTATRQALIS